jgi:hypothetical protein
VQAIGKGHLAATGWDCTDCTWVLVLIDSGQTLPSMTTDESSAPSKKDFRHIQGQVAGKTRAPARQLHVNSPKAKTKEATDVDTVQDARARGEIFQHF